MAGAAERFEDKLDHAFLPFFGACRQSRKGFCGRRLGSEELGQSNGPRDRRYPCPSDRNSRSDQQCRRCNRPDFENDHRSRAHFRHDRGSRRTTRQRDGRNTRLEDVGHGGCSSNDRANYDVVELWETASKPKTKVPRRPTRQQPTTTMFPMRSKKARSPLHKFS